jgi:hypothetical protein
MKKSAARKTSTLPTRIWKFGARFASREDERRATDILYTASRYYNRMVEIERARVERFRAIRARYAPELAVADARWLELDGQISQIYRDTRDTRQRHFRKTGEKVRLLAPEFQERVDALKAEQRKVSDGAKEYRKAFAALFEPAQVEHRRRSAERCAKRGPRIKSLFNAEVLAEMLEEPQWHPAWKEIARSDEEAHKLYLTARNECGLPTGTYLKVEDAFQRARKDTKGRAPGFHPIRPEGLLSVQFRTAGTTYASLIGGTQPLSIRQSPYDPSKKGDQSRMMVATMDQSIPRGEKQSVSATVKMHRAPPPDAIVKWASWSVRRVGARTTVELQLTLEHASFAEQKRPSGSRAPEHIRIGWAGAPGGGARVAHWPGGEVVLPKSILSQHAHACVITHASDKIFEYAKRLIRKHMSLGPHRLKGWHLVQSDRTRKALRDACAGYAQHVLGAERAHEMWRAWVVDRKSRDEDLYVIPSELKGGTTKERFAFWCLLWAKKDAHLQQYAIDEARRFEQRRDAFYRMEAIRISTEFASVTVDDYNIAELKKLEPITMPGDPPRLQGTLQAAAPGRFREILQEAMWPRCKPCGRDKEEVKEAAE